MYPPIIHVTLGEDDTLDNIMAVKMTRYLSCASLMLVIYDYLLTLDKEVRFFWVGPWKTSRILFLFNRYFTPLNIAALLLCQTLLEPSAIFCYNAYHWLFSWWFISLTVVQGILVLRVWYLFLRTPRLRHFVIFLFVATICANAALVAKYFIHVKPWFYTARYFPHGANVNDPSEAVEWVQSGCPGPGPPSPPHFWPLLLPSLILHTVLYLLTTYVALTLEDVMNTPLLRRLVRDGGFFYLIVFFCMGFTMIASAFGGFLLKYISVLSEFPFALISISIGRVMLSIRSLASNCAQPDDWILEMIELQHLNKTQNDRERLPQTWTQGAHPTEFFVEVDDPPGEEALESARSGDTESTTESDRWARARLLRELAVAGHVQGERVR